MKQLDDPDLIRLIIQHDEAALSELFDRYHRLIFSVALNVVGDRETAEEITLDIFTRVWEKADTYRVERAKVSTWLTRMGRNRSIDVLRREAVRPMKYSVSWAEIPREPVAENESPETAAHLTIQKERIRAAIASLPDNQQQALALAYFKGFTHSEIARELNLPLGTVKGRIRSGMQKLRALLQDE
jgi:RNA polymerase sigma-70 factor (ECF subfamily)